MENINNKINAIRFLFFRKLLSLKLLNLNSKNELYIKIRRRINWMSGKIYKASFGVKNSDKIFFVILVSGEPGLFSIHNRVLEYTRYAINNGMIPVVDALSFRNMLINDDEVCEVNGWEKFFYQPDNYSVSEVYKSKNVVFSNSVNLNINYNSIHDNDKIKEDGEFCLKHLRIKPDILQEANDKWKSLVKENEKVLGVIGRGTDYLALHPYKHSIVPSVNELCSIVKELGGERYEKIFLATEDKNIKKNMIEMFGDRLIYTQDKTIDLNNKKTFIMNYIRESKFDGVAIQREYLISVLCLSKCDSLITPVVAGALGACRIKTKYDELKLLDLGLYE